MSGVTAERKREIAIRMAIGARGRQVVTMVLRQSMASVLAGAALGLAASAILSRLAESLLFKITHLDDEAASCLPYQEHPPYYFK